MSGVHGGKNNKVLNNEPRRTRTPDADDATLAMCELADGDGRKEGRKEGVSGMDADGLARVSADGALWRRSGRSAKRQARWDDVACACMQL